MIINMQRYTFLHELYNKHHTFFTRTYLLLYHKNTSPCSALPSKGENKLKEIEVYILIF